MSICEHMKSVPVHEPKTHTEGCEACLLEVTQNGFCLLGRVKKSPRFTNVSRGDFDATDRFGQCA
jgi:hypothetical protein